MTPPQQMAAQAQGPDVYTIILAGIGLILALIFGELLRRLYSNHYKGQKLEQLCRDIKRVEGKLDEHRGENRESHETFYGRIGELETKVAVIESICERLPKP